MGGVATEMLLSLLHLSHPPPHALPLLHTHALLLRNLDYVKSKIV